MAVGTGEFCSKRWRILLEKVADSARKAVKLAEPYKPYGGQFLAFCSISLSTYQTCMKLTRKVPNSANFSAGRIRRTLHGRSIPEMPGLAVMLNKFSFLFAFENFDESVRTASLYYTIVVCKYFGFERISPHLCLAPDRQCLGPLPQKLS